MGYGIVNAEGIWQKSWSRWDNPPRPLAEGETVVECEWDEANNRPVGVTMPSPPPVQQISRRQGQEMLLNLGLLEQVEAAVVAAGPRAKIYYDNPIWLRNDSFVNTLGPQLGLTSQQLDDMFNAASLL